MIQHLPRHDRRRFRQLERILLVIELLAPLRRGATAEELCLDVGELMGEAFCVRTLYRDLQALEQFGIVVRDEGGYREPVRWRCSSLSIRVAVHQAVAELRSELRDPWPTADSQRGAEQ